MKYRAVIFDFDGTLLDTLEDLADSMNAALAERGLPTHPVESYRYFVGDGMMNLARRAAPPGTGDDALADLVDRMGAFYGGNWSKKTKPYPGVPGLLDELSRRGLPLAVLSNKPDAFTRIMARHYFGDRFAVVFGARDGVPRKPDPAAALEIAGLLGLPPESALYLGDTDTDMKTGTAAGMRTIGVSWGFRPVAELTASGAGAIVDRPEEVLALLDGE